MTNSVSSFEMFKLTAFCSLEFVLGTYAFVDDRIVGGQEATRNQFPHQVSIRRLRGTTHFCGGAIVSDRFVLTVAHCTQGILSIPSEIVIAAGAFRHFDDGTLHRVIRIVNHPRFNPRKLENDISTIQTRTQIVFGPNVSAISLPVSNLPDENGLPLTVSGWGQNRVSTPFQLNSPQTLYSISCSSDIQRTTQMLFQIIYNS